ncbi:hypothetical protein CBM2598_U10086 [Cupriavidus taiwanensis]|uniref:Tn3 transposase DDE domain-containing protein n=1 Tax=Cupriavidus taiwanensis TaxID=164546 RepID=A0A7Z7JI10_9BURK|nr:hypothetical protein CBM2597_U10264 [Cupriavidus taiwanensis]SOZ96265.1 hypothetical protein CBM2598_U10086 [Cupriavidus taiwanensis]SPC25769.1 hypothetical protein CBM2594_U10270 [Cupriavidus taiwanensis]
MLWNTVYLERAVQALHGRGEPVDPALYLYSYPSPLGWEHFNLTCDYVWRQSHKFQGGEIPAAASPARAVVTGGEPPGDPHGC